MSIAALQPPAAVYREEQNFAWWIYALLALMAFLAWVAASWAQSGAAPPVAPPPRLSLELPIGLAVGLTLPSVLILGVLRMTTEVTPAGVGVWFGWVPTYRQGVPLAMIERVEVVQFRPIVDYGFWGIRSGRDGERALIARGDAGVRLHLTDGRRLLIGSQTPEALAAAVDRALHPQL